MLSHARAHTHTYYYRSIESRWLDFITSVKVKNKCQNFVAMSVPMLLVPAVKGVRLFRVFYSDLGVHVDGFISNVAHSLVVGATKVSHAVPSTASCPSALVGFLT